MPWLAATAFLHSVMIQERRDAADLERPAGHPRLLAVYSGPPHALRRGELDPRSPRARSAPGSSRSSPSPWPSPSPSSLWRLRCSSPTKLESPISWRRRSSTTTCSCSLCLTILGRRLPDALGGGAGRGRRARSLLLRLLPPCLRAPAAPAHGHRPADRVAPGVARQPGHDRWPTAVAVVTGAALARPGGEGSVPGLVAYTFSAFVAATIVLEFARGTRARKALGGGVVARGVLVAHRAQPPTVRRLRRACLDRPARHRDRGLERVRFGGRRGQARARGSMGIGDYTLTYRSLDERQAANATEIRATLGVTRGDRDLGTLEPARTRTRSSSRSRTRSVSAATG